jgi:glycolate oxidase FAD binding subunit
MNGDTQSFNELLPRIMNNDLIDELRAKIKEQPRVCIQGCGSKTALACAGGEAAQVSTSGLAGMLEYEPDEFTFTALAGTPVAEVERVLAQQNQFLPFGPVLSGAGATLGGTVASGLSGAGRYRYGGVRDFILGVQFIDGGGELVRSGGKVVKNAAGFDLPKFMVGSLGCFGLLTELSFKVLPRPEATATLVARYHSLVNGLEALGRLTRQPLELYALDLDGEANLHVRVGGKAESIPARLERISLLLSGVEMETIQGEGEARFWSERNEFGWLAPEETLVKAPITPKRVPSLDGELRRNGAKSVYSAGANVAWIGWPGEVAEIDALLVQLGLSGLRVLGDPGRARLGVQAGESFEKRIKQALDPAGRFACSG